MTKKSYKSLFRIVPLLVMLFLLLTGCKCKHEWVDANCTTPKTCSLCQVTESEALGHTYADATCEAPRTCSVCNATDGEPLGHTWVDATCQVAKTCSVCQKAEGDKLEHTLAEATVTKEASCTEKGILTTVCTVCNQTQSTEEIPINGQHTYTSTITKTATCTQTGSKTLTCTACNHQTIQSIPATGHKFTGATCVKEGTCSVCNTTGAKGDHSFVVTYDEWQMQIADTFAAKRIQKCSLCSVEKTEYSSRGNTYDLDAMMAELVTYAKSLGFTITDTINISIYQQPTSSVTYQLTNMNLVDQGAPYILENAKNTIKHIYDEKKVTDSPLGSIYIKLSYVQSGAIGAGAFNSTIHYSR